MNNMTNGPVMRVYRPTYTKLLITAAVVALSLLFCRVALAVEKHPEETSGLKLVPMEANPNTDAREIPLTEPTDALLLSTDIEVVVTGLIVRSRVKQVFHNKSTVWMEGIYRFPLPDAAAVDGMSLLIGDRRIVSE